MEKLFQGTYTAIVTPFKKDKSFDEASFRKLVEFQLKNNITGIVPVGTTGESPTLSGEEAKKVISVTVEMCKGKVKVIAGTGSNSTAHAVEMTRFAKEAGADAALIVNPYYNKPTQKGLYLHFKTIADAVDIPIVVYNIKGRTGVNVETETLVKLMNDCKNIVAVKEASGSIDQMKSVIKNAKEGFCVLSGDDNMTLDLIKAGGDGVISVASNIVPEKIVSLVDLALANKIEEAEKLNEDLSDLFSACFIETNPIPIKTALSMKGMCEEVFRLPMCTMEEENKAKLKAVLKSLKLV